MQQVYKLGTGAGRYTCNSKRGDRYIRLTNKQEEYVKGLIDGLSQRQAYYRAYPNSRKWKPETVDSRASELFKNGKVLGRYRELKGEISREYKDKKLWDMERTTNKLIWLIETAEMDIAENGFRQANSTAFLNALKELNELEGLGAERKVRIELNKAKIEETYSKMQSESTESKLENYLETLNEALEND